MGPGLGLAFSKVTVPQALHWIFPEVSAVIAQVWPLTLFYSVDFSQSMIDVKKCVFNKRTIKVYVSSLCVLGPPSPSGTPDGVLVFL